MISVYFHEFTTRNSLLVTIVYKIIIFIISKERKRLEAEENAKRRFPRRLPKELGGPLTPQERPVVLPGGRKWRNERDAFNEEFIAEVISSQAELITGSTLG